MNDAIENEYKQIFESWKGQFFWAVSDQKTKE